MFKGWFTVRSQEPSLNFFLWISTFGNPLICSNVYNFIYETAWFSILTDWEKGKSVSLFFRRFKSIIINSSDFWLRGFVVVVAVLNCGELNIELMNDFYWFVKWKRTAEDSSKTKPPKRIQQNIQRQHLYIRIDWTNKTKTGNFRCVHLTTSATSF